jgi:putative endonuclease
MWHVYIVQCSDLSLYTGATNDLGKRLAAHNSGRGAKYTRSRLPVRLVHMEHFRSKGRALAREMAIKRLDRRRKLGLAGPGAGAADGKKRGA